MEKLGLTKVKNGARFCLRISAASHHHAGCRVGGSVPVKSAMQQPQPVVKGTSIGDDKRVCSINAMARVLPE